MGFTKVTITILKKKKKKKPITIERNIHGWEPWFCDYGRRLMFLRSWVRIPALHAGYISLFEIDQK